MRFFFITFSRTESLSEITSSEATGKIIGQEKEFYFKFTRCEWKEFWPPFATRWFCRHLLIVEFDATALLKQRGDCLSSLSYVYPHSANKAEIRNESRN